MVAIEWVNKNTQFIASEFMKALDEAVNDIQKDFISDYKKVSGNWSPPPTFTPLKTGEISVSTKKFNWLDNGTSKRMMRMSEDWKSKTSPGYLGRGAGRGRPIGFSKRPLPGIRKRLWTMASAYRQLSQGTMQRRVERRVRQRARSMFR